MKQKYFTSFIIVMCLCSCKEKENPLVYEMEIKIESNNIVEFDLAKISDFENMIPLETTEDNLIKKIKQVFLTDSLIIVWDENSVFVFNDKGKFLYPIGKRGEGPDEYGQINHVHVDYKTFDITVLSNSRKVIDYHVSGKTMSSYYLPFFSNAIYPSKEGMWINSGHDKSNYTLLLLNESKEIVSDFLPAYPELTFMQVNNFVTDNKNQLFYYTDRQDVIYQIREKELQPYIYINFGDNKNPYTEMSSRGFRSVIAKNEYVGNVNNLYMSDNRLFFSFQENFGERNNIEKHYACADLNHPDSVAVYGYNTVLHANEIPVQPTPDIIGLSQGKLIYEIVPEILPDNLTEKLRESPALKNAAYKDITADSNPILVIYRLKPNS